MSAEFQSFLREKGIHHETTVPYSPQQNGIAERINRTLQEAALSMILHAGVSKGFWAEAVFSAAYIRNRVITTATGVTPYERWYGKKPDVSNLRVFGCTAYGHVPDSLRQKLDQKAVKMRFVGYGLTQKGYRFYDDNKRKIFICRDVIFNETETKIGFRCDQALAISGQGICCLFAGIVSHEKVVGSLIVIL